MEITNAWHALPATSEAAAAGRYGVVLRLARTARNLTLEEAGALCGHSASSLSRFETGVKKLTDVITMRRFAIALGIPLHLFGLAGPDTPTRPPPAATLALIEPRGGEVVQRRTLLTGVFGVSGAALLPVPAVADRTAAGRLDELLFSPEGKPAAPLTVDHLKAVIAQARADFKAVRYTQLSERLGGLISSAVATRDATMVEERGGVEALVADAYGLAVDLLLKLHENPVAWAMADRAAAAARASGDPRVIALAQRNASIVMRRSQHRHSARALATQTATQFAAASGVKSPADASFYASLLATASYTAALDDRREAASELAEEAAVTLASVGSTGFTNNDLTLYRVGIARALGDYGHAVEYASQVRLDLLITPERKARYWEDAAFALFGRGRPTDAYQAMRNAETAAPQEVKLRPWALQLTESLLSLDTRNALPGLRDFAARIGVGG